MDDFEILHSRRFARWYMRKLRDARNKWRDKAVKLNEKVEQLEFFYEGNGFKKRGLNNSIQIADYIEKLEKQMRRYIERTKTVYTKPDHAMKEKIWTSAELVNEDEAAEYIEDVIDEK